MSADGVALDLGGTWRAAAADEDLRRRFPDDDLDDAGWVDLEVPGHWRSQPAFAGHDGPLLHRRRFEAPAPAEGRRAWLTLHGVFYQGDVWLDGSYLGDTEGYFAPHTFEVTDALRGRGDHLLAVEVACSRPGDLAAKRNLTGVFQHSDTLDPEWNPGGIWRPVRVHETGPVRIAGLRFLCLEASAERAVVRLRAVLDADAAAPVRLRTTIGGTDHEAEHVLAAGENRVDWRVTVTTPALWWPRALGEPLLHDVAVEVHVGDGTGDAPSDRRAFRSGLREIRMKRWVARVNGERLFLKGAAAGPTRQDLAAIAPDAVRADVQLALDANLDLLRVHGHIARPELYAAADEAGLLLWQDLPLQWAYARGTRKQAVLQARAAVDLLSHHPSIAVWCGHNEPFAEPAGGRDRFRAARYVARQELPSWNKSVLDGSIRRALARADGSRPVVPHSGVLPHPGSRGSDAHLSLGWVAGDLDDLPRLLAAWPRLARFVGEFGAQAVPTTDDFVDPARWPHLDWDRLEGRHSLQRDRLERRVPVEAHASYAAWRDATQRYQAALVKHHVETLRRLKYRPTGGFVQYCLTDGAPGITCAVVDHARVPKAGFAALAAACAPVIVVADHPPARCTPGDALALDVHVVNDRRRPLPGTVVRATLSWPGGSHGWAWTGDVPPDDCVRVGTLQAVVPDVAGELVLDLSLEHPEAISTNRYSSLLAAR